MKKQLFFSLLILFALLNTVKGQWSLTGNANTTPGTNYIGTTDSKDIVFKTSSSNERIRIQATTGYIGIGTAAPTQKLQVDYGNILIKGTNNFTTGGDQAVLYLGDNSNYIRSVNGKGVAIGVYMYTAPYYADAINISSGGNVSIGTSNPGSFKLAVEGTIGAREIRVLTTTPFPDFVFQKDYKLMPINELELYVITNKHLPEIPSAKEIEKNNGVPLGEISIKLLQKLEEQTLYIIQLQKQIDELKESIKK